MGITVNVELSDPTPENIVLFAKEKLKGLTFHTLFVSCTNFRAVEAKPALESAFGVRVMASNSAVINNIKERFAD